MPRIRSRVVLRLVPGAALALAGAHCAGHSGSHGTPAAAGAGHAMPAGEICQGFGPQAPRDIDNQRGDNRVVFDLAPQASTMRLCNIHFHENAEHRAEQFSIYAGDGHDGYGGGYQCNISKDLTPAELARSAEGVCRSAHGDLQPGDTIEVHWVHTTCDVEGGPTLAACVSDACANPQLRVETQVFALVADGGLDFDALQSAANLPTDTGEAVEFIGSTTGPSYSEQVCSPYQVTWSVRPSCAKLNIGTVATWCEGNKYNEDHAHGVRKLVTNPKLLSEIQVR